MKLLLFLVALFIAPAQAQTTASAVSCTTLQAAFNACTFTKTVAPPVVLPTTFTVGTIAFNAGQLTGVTATSTASVVATFDASAVQNVQKVAPALGGAVIITLPAVFHDGQPHVARLQAISTTGASAYFDNAGLADGYTFTWK
jgi:hypothetical protein